MDKRAVQEERMPDMRLVKLWETDIRRAYELQNTFAENEHGFVNGAYGLSFDGFKNYVKKKEEHSRGIDLPEGFVPDTVYILEAGEDYAGIFNLRHYLNDSLRKGAGHIGYGISPRYRGRGYATEGLRLLIEIAKDIIPEDEIYMHVHRDNLSSLRVQQKNGAYICRENDVEYFTRIKKAEY